MLTQSLSMPCLPLVPNHSLKPRAMATKARSMLERHQVLAVVLQQLRNLSVVSSMLLLLTALVQKGGICSLRVCVTIA